LKDIVRREKQGAKPLDGKDEIRYTDNAKVLPTGNTAMNKLGLWTKRMKI
jgi:hypothetical protein